MDIYLRALRNLTLRLRSRSTHLITVKPDRSVGLREINKQ